MESGTKVGKRCGQVCGAQLLIVDDEVVTRNLCNDVAWKQLHVYASSTTEQALDILDQYPDHIVVTI